MEIQEHLWLQVGLRLTQAKTNPAYRLNFLILNVAISPSIRAYKETLNTLRFAQRAKFIVNQPVNKNLQN